MKKTILFLSLSLFGLFASAQNFPYGINYQGVARDANGNAQTTHTVNLRFTVAPSTSTTTVIYQETQSKVTNNLGQFNAVIGTGTTAQTFSSIPWQGNIYNLIVEIDPGSGYQIISNQSLQAVPYALATIDPTPAGVISAFGGTAAPAGYLLCDGSAVLRTGLYANLFAAIGTAYGSGNGSTTFNLPDFRGMFLRGVDATAGNDPDKSTRTASNPGGNTGNNVGSKQTDDFKSHTHTVNATGVTNFGGGSTGWGFYGGGSTGALNNTGGNETRPKNVYVNYIIKY